jgi:hypothetical protein
MKRAQIDALMGAHRQRAHVVSSLHVLCQAVLEPDDHAFLQEHIDALGGADFLRWLSRCQGVSKAPVIRALASLAERDLHQFRFEILGSGDRFLDEHDWAELAELLWGKAPPDIERALLARTAGCSIYRALLHPTPWSPGEELTAAELGAEGSEGGGGAGAAGAGAAVASPGVAGARASPGVAGAGEGSLGTEARAGAGRGREGPAGGRGTPSAGAVGRALAERVAAAFEDVPGQPSIRLLRELFPIRHDERACRRRLQGPAPAAVGAAHLIWEIDRAGLMDQVGWPFALLPASTRFLCEAGADEGGAAALREAYIRHRALALPGDAVRLGRAWYAAQLVAAVGRGVPWLALLREVPESMRASLPEAAPELRARVAREARELPLPLALSARQLVPWAIDLPSLVAIAQRDARSSERDWGPSIAGFPPELAGAVMERARASPRGEERACLLEWLGQREVPRRQLVELAVESLGESEVCRAMIAWVARQLGSRSAWEQHGPRVIKLLIDRGCYSDLGDLLTLSWSEVGSDSGGGRAGEGEVPKGFKEALHFAFASALLEATRQALDAGAIDRATAGLSALACLDPPSRLSRALHAIGQRPDLPEEVRQLISINAGMVKHGDGRDASLQGAIAAVHVLADALVPAPR